MKRSPFAWMGATLAWVGAVSCLAAPEDSAPADGGAGGEIPCATDATCGGTHACVANRCVRRQADIGSWAIEIDPPRGSGSQLTELTSVGRGTQVLTASPEIELTVAVMSASAPLPTSASIIVTAPSKIPGLAARSFQGPFDPVRGAARVALPEALRGQTGTASLIPLHPADQQSWPYASPITVPSAGAPNPSLVLPPNPFSVRGLVLDALGGAKVQFTARIFRSGVLVSTAAATTPSANNVAGNFVVLVPPDSADGLTVELAPGPDTSDPWVTLSGLSLTQPYTDLGNLTLPAYAVANPFRVTAHGDDAGQTAVPGARVRAYTTLGGGDPRLTVRFFRDGQTDASGAAQLQLIPGATVEPQRYTVSVVPPPDSLWASACVADVPAQWIGANAPAALLRDVVLKQRPVITGTVLSAGGTPVANVTVTAKGGRAATPPCLPGPAESATLTDAAGSFTLPVDPGAYRLEYDPPTGSPVPRMTELDVVVDKAQTRIVRLPAAVVVEGDVRNAAGNPLPFATVRIYSPCTPPCAAPTLLRAETQADANGRFRAVVAAPSPN